jgi:hypothetical protein
VVHDNVWKADSYLAAQGSPRFRECEILTNVLSYHTLRQMNSAHMLTCHSSKFNFTISIPMTVE